VAVGSAAGAVACSAIDSAISSRPWFFSSLRSTHEKTPSEEIVRIDDDRSGLYIQYILWWAGGQGREGKVAILSDSCDTS
jgi:hypothetical protein